MVLIYHLEAAMKKFYRTWLLNFIIVGGRDEAVCSPLTKLNEELLCREPQIHSQYNTDQAR